MGLEMDWLPAVGIGLGVGLGGMYLVWSVNTFVNGGIEDDDRKFERYGVDPLNVEALPYYARWVRQDVIGLFYMVNRATIIFGGLLVLIAIPLWMMALR